MNHKNRPYTSIHRVRRVFGLIGLVVCWYLVFAFGFDLGLRATVDEDGSGMSDVYERKYGAQSANSDLDRDGYTYSQEYLLGLNPNNQSDGSGLIRAEALKTSATTAQTFLHGKAGKGLRYQLERSTDLRTWTTLPNVYLGNEDTKLIQTPENLLQSPTVFFGDGKPSAHRTPRTGMRSMTGRNIYSAPIPSTPTPMETRSPILSNSSKTSIPPLMPMRTTTNSLMTGNRIILTTPSLPQLRIPILTV